jgi:hypothetical protein
MYSVLDRYFGPAQRITRRVFVQRLGGSTIRRRVIYINKSKKQQMSMLFEQKSRVS